MGDGELRFEGRTAIVTGAGSGIGRAHAVLLASRGAHVVVNDVGWTGYAKERVDGSSRAEAVAREIREAGGSAVSNTGDVTKEDDAHGMVQQALHEFGCLDILVNNAGVSERARTPVQQLPNEELDELFRVHVLGTLRMTRAAWPTMERASYGRILTTGSAAAVGHFQHEQGGYIGAYAAAKSALFALTRQLAGAGRVASVHVNMVMPWGSTPMSEETLRGTPFGQWVESNLGVDKVAAGVLWFLHDDCDVSGEFISAAGGRVARITFAQSRGYFNRDISPEDVRDHWDAVRGSVTDDDEIHDMIELTGQPREAQILFDLFGPPAAAKTTPIVDN